MNKKVLKFGILGISVLSGLPAFAQQINPMTEAVLQNYNEILEENPTDYMTLFDRASQYYEMGEYARALSDVDMALENTPSQDKDYRLAEFSLKADILTSQKNYQEAVAAVNKALELNPVSQADLYKAGNLYLILNQPDEALKTFQRLQRESPRSQEAFYGMAKANSMLGRNDEAVNLIKEIENLGKQSFVTYCRIGDLYQDMGNIKEATTNYAIAYTMEDSNQRPVESLKFMARKNPQPVIESLDALGSTNKDNIALNYLKAIVAYDGGLYSQSERAAKDLASSVDEDSPAVYRMMAMSQLAQNKIEEAISSINTAEKLAPSNPGVQLDKAEILMSINPDESYKAATSALNVSPDDQNAQLVAAKSAILSGKYPEAMNYLNELVLVNPSNIEALLLRGYLNTEYLKDPKAGIADYTRAGNVNQSNSVSDLVMGAIAKAKVNKKLDADGMINDAIQAAGNNKEDLYWIAVYFAQNGNLEKAKEYTDKAMLNGYNNLYNLKTNNEPLLNLSPIHHLTK